MMFLMQIRVVTIVVLAIVALAATAQNEEPSEVALRFASIDSIVSDIQRTIAGGGLRRDAELERLSGEGLRFVAPLLSLADKDVRVWRALGWIALAESARSDIDIYTIGRDSALSAIAFAKLSELEPDFTSDPELSDLMGRLNRAIPWSVEDQDSDMASLREEISELTQLSNTRDRDPEISIRLGLFWAGVLREPIVASPAQRLFEEAVRSGHVGQTLLGALMLFDPASIQLAYDKEQPEIQSWGIQLLQQASAEGGDDATMLLALFHAVGWEVPLDQEESRRLLNESALEGHRASDWLRAQLSDAVESPAAPEHSEETQLLYAAVSFLSAESDLADRRLVRELAQRLLVPLQGEFDVTFCGLSSPASFATVYVIDATGSMITNFGIVVEELARSIDALVLEQSFQIIFFHKDNEVLVVPPGDSLLKAVPEEKIRALEWIREHVIAAGRSNPIEAIKAALALEPDLIFMLSNDITGSGQFEIDEKDLLAMLDELNPRVRNGVRRTQIQCVQILDDDPLETLKKIALEHSDERGYKFLSREDLGVGGTSVKFFTAEGEGNRFAFIIDVSGSMGESRKLQTALGELARSVDSLPDFAYFHVLLFHSDVAGPEWQKGWTRARPRDVERLITWLDSVRPGGGTQPIPAFARAFALDVPPDVIFFLTDGQIPDDSATLIADMNRRGGGVVINTIAFGDPRSQDELKQIAEQSGGKYRFVPVGGESP